MDYRFGPIHGDRRDPPVYEHHYENSGFDVYSGTLRAHFGHSTNAYMVDDDQMDTQPPEFFLHPDPRYTPNHQWQEADIGFSYWGEDNAHMWYHQVSAETHWSTWDPVLPISANWAVYVFVPNDHAWATNAYYQVGVVKDNRWEYTDVYINQQSVENEFVRLQAYEGQTFQTQAAGQWQLSVRLVGCPGCAPYQEIGSDAALLIPEGDCDPP